MSSVFSITRYPTHKITRRSSADHTLPVVSERLHEFLRQEDIAHLHKMFTNHPDQKMSFEDLRNALVTVNVFLTDSQYRTLFLKINQNSDFKCDWDEFVSHLIFGFQEDDPNNQKEALIRPIYMAPTIKKSEHRSPIVAITLIRDPFESPNDVIAKGTYATASKEGGIKFWSMEMEITRSGQSDSYYLQMQTWILCIEALSDVRVLCTSSTEREIRFHDTMASNFNLRIVIRSMPFAVYNLSYSHNADTTSKLILGDLRGNIMILEFSPFLRGPFQSKTGNALIELTWANIMKGKFKAFKPRELLNIHQEMIQQSFYSLKMDAIFCAAEYRNVRKYRGRCPGLITQDLKENRKTIFGIPMGVSSFYLDEVNRILATGGPDTYLRLWDPLISAKPSVILTGHRSGIVLIFIQPEEKKVYSLDYQKIIKVWHLHEHNLLQSYGDLCSIIPQEYELAYFYNHKSRELLVGGRKLISIKCCPRIRMDLTDGNTHSAPVSVVLYNGLFRNVVTCGLDSYIIVWDPCSGKRQIIMKECHTRLVHGELVTTEITAACFDPMDQFLLTGARDGSLKIWNYNNAVCVRNMSIEFNCEVTSVCWLEERILAVGWNRHVTEFADSVGQEYADAKNWESFHGDDVTTASVKFGEGLCTGTYSGELILWKLETGQPYRRYNVAEPKKFLELVHATKRQKEQVLSTRKQKKSLHSEDDPGQSETRSVHKRLIQLTRQSITAVTQRVHEEDIYDAQAQALKNAQAGIVPSAVQVVLFLQTRIMSIDVGSLFVALDNGMVQVYSHHQRGGFITEFNTIHKTGDCVLTMTTDKYNKYLFTGTAFGYIKIWLVQNFCLPEKEKPKVVMPLLRLQFIFLRNDRFKGRAKRVVRHQKEPLLCSSYKAHLKAITSLTYVNATNILLSGSHDCSCRLWSLGGRYLGTLGTPLPWITLSPVEPVSETAYSRIPPDIKKVASSATLKVLSGLYVDRVNIFNMYLKRDEEGHDKSGAEDTCVYSKPITEPILGKHFEPPKRHPGANIPYLETISSYIPVYSHLELHEADTIVRPPTPEAIRKTKNLDFMEFYNSSTGK